MKAIANVYLRGQGVNKVVMVGPGRKLEFRGGAAAVSEERDMPTVLQMAGVAIEIDQRYADFLADWATQCPPGMPAVADVRIMGPEADDILIGPPPVYAVTRPEPVPAPDVEPDPNIREMRPDPRWTSRPRRSRARVE